MSSGGQALQTLIRPEAVGALFGRADGKAKLSQRNPNQEDKTFRRGWCRFDVVFVLFGPRPVTANAAKKR